MYKYNNGVGAVICDKCKVIFDSHLSYAEYLEMYDNEKQNICWKCKEKTKDKKDKLEIINDGWKN